MTSIQKTIELLKAEFKELTCPSDDILEMLASKLLACGFEPEDKEFNSINKFLDDCSVCDFLNSKTEEQAEEVLSRPSK